MYAVDNGGNLWAWGYSSEGILGTVTPGNYTSVPVRGFSRRVGS